MPASYEGKRISQIRFDPPTQPVARADLARLFPFQPGTVIHLTEVRDAIKRLYGTGLYSNIAIETEPAADGVVMIVRTTEQWFVGPVEVNGKVKTPPNAGQLTAATRLDLGAPFDDDNLQQAENGIKDLLQRNGLYLSTVDPKVERDAEHQLVSMTFRVNSGRRARLATPTITGETRLTQEQLVKAAKYKGWFRWKFATEENTERGVNNIRSKYEQKDRLTASVNLERTEYNPTEKRVHPIIQADGGPKVKLEAAGAKVSKSNLKKYVPVFDEGTVNRDLLVNGVRNLRDFFQNRGYFDVDVDYSTSQPSADQQIITYNITPGPRHKVVKVEINGNRYFKTDQIRERMFIQPAGFVRLRHGRFSDGFSKRDAEAIRALYRDNGFRDVKIDIASQDDLEGKVGNVGITVNIVEGPQYRVSKLNVQGITRRDKATILALLSSSDGQPFSETNVAIDRDYILNLYQSSGYPDVNFEYKVAPGPGPHQFRVNYNVSEGQPRYVRDVLIYGMRASRHRLVDPNILLKAGDPLSWTDMGRTQRRLYNLGVFDKVDMAIQNPDGDTQNKYVLFHVTEGHRYFMAVGLGAEFARIGGNQQSLADSGGATGFAPRGNLEISRLNMWGLGHSLNFKGRYSTLDRRISLNYLAPRYRNVAGLNISVTGLYDNTRDVLTFTARRLEGSFQVSQQLSKPTQVFWRYTWRDVRVDQNTLKIEPGLIPLLSRDAHVAMISGNLVQDHRDDPSNAHRGYYNTLDLGLVDRHFGGNVNFLRFLARNSYYKRVTHDLVLASNTQFGWIRPFNLAPTDDPAQYVPIAERFYGGGSNSMRGFPDNQAGPRDPRTGFPIGGSALLFHSTELRFPLLGENIDGVLFHDLGNVFSTIGDISFRFHQTDPKDFNYMVHAAGFGIRYKTPVGPVRVDIAYSFNPPSYNGLQGTYYDLIHGTATPTVQSIRAIQFFFSIGQAF